MPAVFIREPLELDHLELADWIIEVRVLYSLLGLVMLLFGRIHDGSRRAGHLGLTNTPQALIALVIS